MKQESLALVALAFVALPLAACENKPAEPAASAPAAQTATAASTATAPLASASAAPSASAARALFASGATETVQAEDGPRVVHKVPARPTDPVSVADEDPVKGKWTLADATRGLAGKGSLLATIETELGTLECKLYEDKTPLTVANFVGLARGLRPWKTPSGSWQKKPAYDGTSFHRVIRGFMIQGGDPKGDGTGEPGYVIPDEIWQDGVHDRAGLLCMANRGRNTNGAQFFITDAAAPHLDNAYTIFGECRPEDVVHQIAAVEVLPRRDRPKNPPKIVSIKVKRGTWK